MWSKKHCSGRTVISVCFQANSWEIAFVPFERAGRHGRSVSYAELSRLFVLLVKVLLGKCCKLCAIFLLDGCALAVELLYIFKPGDAMAEPCIGGFEAILGRFLLAMRMLREHVKGASNAGARQKGRPQ